eukprot:TRINITY_DN12072_c0_g1_i4.p2 TRINITY_DN12072_c0_g1~~TRINITY_DN12072_c0_g1_i4.p2  ORF type:complete len:116 (+),score=20.10 TRINITY_DN12072_c0_g1_i4:62-409(+)
MYFLSSVFLFLISLLYFIFIFFFFLMIRRPPRSTLSSSSAASDVYKRQVYVHSARAPLAPGSSGDRSVEALVRAWSNWPRVWGQVLPDGAFRRHDSRHPPPEEECHGWGSRVMTV